VQAYGMFHFQGRYAFSNMKTKGSAKC